MRAVCGGRNSWRDVLSVMFWFRVNGSKIGRSGSWGFENKYTAYELGYDEVIKRTDDFVRYNGVALNYTDGSSSYRSGNGGNDAKAISFYV